MKHLPKRRADVPALNFMRVFEKELTTYPASETDDTVMADWCGEWNLDKIITLGRRVPDKPITPDPGVKLPPYLRRQAEVVELHQ
jgi:hypothetical protein